MEVGSIQITSAGRFRFGRPTALDPTATPTVAACKGQRSVFPSSLLPNARPLEHVRAVLALRRYSLVTSISKSPGPARLYPSTLTTAGASSVTDPSFTQKGQAPCLPRTPLYSDLPLMTPMTPQPLSKRGTAASRQTVRSTPRRRSRKRKRPSMAGSSPNAPTANTPRTSPSTQSDARPKPRSRSY